MADKQPINLYLIAGFLGAGKTSFLRSALSDLKGERVGVIVNDFGSVGIDGTVLQSGDVMLVEINNGSIFCACLKGGFTRTLAAFLEQPVDHLFVEASGLADPDNMGSYLDQVERLMAKKPEVTRRYHYRGSVCLVDAVHYEDLSDVFPVLTSQVEKSRFVIINKSDDIPGAELKALKAHVRELNPEAFMWTTNYGKVPLGILKENLVPESDVRETLNTPDNRPVTYLLAVPRTTGGSGQPGEHSCDDRADGPYPPAREAVEAFCREIAPLTLRLKGFAETASGLLHVDGVADDLNFSLRSAEAYRASAAARPDRGRSLRQVEESFNKLMLIGKSDLLTEAVIRDAWERHVAVEMLLTEE